MRLNLKFIPYDRRLLKAIYSFSQDRKSDLYLVGGALRDCILARDKDNPDYDFAIKKNAISFGRALAKKLKCAFVVLDKEHGSCRLVKKYKDKIYTFDFTDFRGKDIGDDLKHRDFTINAIALNLKNSLSGSDFSFTLIDPQGGVLDIKNKLIRMVGSEAFAEDPLRILRAFVFSSSLGFAIDKGTLKAAKLNKEKLTLVSAERIREELFKIFATPRAYDCLIALDKIKALDIIFSEIKKMRRIGQGPYHHLDVWQHTLETVKQLEVVFEENKDEDIKAYLETAISSDRRRKAILKFGAFLHDFGKPKTLRKDKGRTTFHGHERVGLRIAEEIGRRIKLSNDELNSLRKIVLWHLRPGYLADSKNPTARAKFRFFRDAGVESLGILLLSLADQRSTKGPFTTFKTRQQHEKVVASLIKEHLMKGKEKKQARLLNGDEVMKRFKLPPSPLVGRVLSLIEELQAIGKIKNKEEAFKSAAKVIRAK